jgi:peptidoglycan/xylan/chitin deacetylase (PgdA/CDA1 family)
VERALLSVSAGRGPRTRGRVLCYHSVGTAAWGLNDVSPARFRRHLELALRAGYRFVPASEIAETGGGPADLALTFDDGLVSVARNAERVLTDLAIPWTLFVVTGWADGQKVPDRDVVMNWKDIELMARRGAVIGSHSSSHRNFAQLSDVEIELELASSGQSIQRHLGVAPTAFAIPFGRARDWPAGANAAATAAGYRHIYAQAEVRRPSNTVARTFITRYDGDRMFMAALAGAFDNWEEAY